MYIVIINRVARTVVIGGLLNDDIAEEVHSLARESGSVSSITYPLPKEEITHHGKGIFHPYLVITTAILFVGKQVIFCTFTF